MLMSEKLSLGLSLISLYFLIAVLLCMLGGNTSPCNCAHENVSNTRGLPAASPACISSLREEQNAWFIIFNFIAKF